MLTRIPSRISSVESLFKIASSPTGRKTASPRGAAYRQKTIRSHSFRSARFSCPSITEGRGNPAIKRLTKSFVLRQTEALVKRLTKSFVRRPTEIHVKRLKKIVCTVTVGCRNDFANRSTILEGRSFRSYRHAAPKWLCVILFSQR